MSCQVLSEQIITTKSFQNVFNFVLGERYQINVHNKEISFGRACVLL